MSSMIQSISGAAQPPAAVPGVKEASAVQRPEAGPQVRSLKPVTDQYIPEEPQAPTGLYWLGSDEEGQPKIYFDDPDRKDSGKPAELCTANTDQVDREIEALKQKQQELKQQLSAQTDDAKRAELEKKLTQTERELSQKDNDTYRRQHTVFS